jgi:hypothetical protein
MFSQPSPSDAVEELCFNVLALLPQESIVSFETDLPVTGEIVVAMPNLETLYLFHPVVSDGFLLPDPNGPNADKKLLPSLRWLYLEDAERRTTTGTPLSPTWPTKPLVVKSFRSKFSVTGFTSVRG